MTERRTEGLPHLEQPKFPESLTPKDIELINKQCEIQRATSKREIEGFAHAYLEAKTLAHDTEALSKLLPSDFNDLIKKLGRTVDFRNAKGWRQVAVRFRSGNSGLNPMKIQRAMMMFSENISDGTFSPLEAYYEFETIHPFEDGNGRVGDLLWKLTMKRLHGSWPEELPPDLFSLDETERKAMIEADVLAMQEKQRT